MRRAPFPRRAERALIAALVVAIAMIAQRWSIEVFRAGLLLMVAATLLQIAVGNLPETASPGRSIVLIALVLCLIAAVFGLGVLLTPFLSQLGR